MLFKKEDGSLIGILLSLVDSEYRHVPGTEDRLKNDIDLCKSLIKLARDNGLLYFLIHKFKELNIKLPDLETAWDEEEKKKSQFINSLRIIKDVSTEAGLDYLLIKRYATILNVPRDVDIFVRREQKEKIVQALQNKNMRCVQKGITETALELDGYLRIDIYTEITYITVNFIDNDYLWNSKTEVKLFGDKHWTLSDEADLLLTLVHNVLGHRRITLLDFLHIKSLINCISLETYERYLYDKGWGRSFDIIVEKMLSIQDIIDKGHTNIMFPYLFDRKFILKFISSIDKLSLSPFQKAFLYISLIQDEILHKIKGTALYEWLRSYDAARALVNSLAVSTRKLRGDKKSRW